MGHSETKLNNGLNGNMNWPVNDSTSLGCVVRCLLDRWREGGPPHLGLLSGYLLFFGDGSHTYCGSVVLHNAQYCGSVVSHNA